MIDIKDYGHKVISVFEDEKGEPTCSLAEALTVLAIAAASFIAVQAKTERDADAMAARFANIMKRETKRAYLSEPDSDTKH